MSGIMDLSFLTEEEQRKILDVLKRDERLKKEEDRRVRKLRQELQELRKKGAIKADTDNSGKKCARCRESLGWFINAGELCPKCQHKVCKKCQVLQTSGRRKWLCLVCNKQMEIKARTGEWFYEKIPQVNNAKLVGTDLVRASMRSGPPSRGKYVSFSN
ncbi:synaptotagmin-like protein 4 [Saccoglossus kowalevskii]|uniref:Synaptotagmin-like protein 4-like n=1 Tax=Saccoglossus kowalevskii TaxID=10224 RepID=A0ABM0LUR6_SACKO|nr:PREDICTED: synaptotagmin-like protein 4-like [Saccoglossus kowalevskii]